MLGSGLSTIEVADMLSLSPVTVRRQHLSRGGQARSRRP